MSGIKSPFAAARRRDLSSQQFRDKYQALLRESSSESETVESGSFSMDSDSDSDRDSDSDSDSEGTDFSLDSLDSDSFGTDGSSLENSEHSSIDGTSSVSPQEDFFLDSVCGWFDRPLCMKGQQQSLLVQSTKAAAFRNVKVNKTLYLAAKAKLSDDEQSQTESGVGATEGLFLMDSASSKENFSGENAKNNGKDDGGAENTAENGKDEVSQQSVETEKVKHVGQAKSPEQAEDDTTANVDLKIAVDDESLEAFIDSRVEDGNDTTSTGLGRQDDGDIDHILDLFLSESDPSQNNSAEEQEGIEIHPEDDSEGIETKHVSVETSVKSEVSETGAMSKITKDSISRILHKKMQSPKTDLIDLTKIVEDGIPPSPSVSSFGPEKKEETITTTHRETRDPPPSETNFRFADAEVREHEVAHKEEKEEKKRDSGRKQADEYSPRSPLLEKNTIKGEIVRPRFQYFREEAKQQGKMAGKSPRPDPVEATTIERKHKTPDVRPRQIHSDGSFSSRALPEDTSSNTAKLRDLVVVRSIDASQKLRQSRGRTIKQQPRQASPRPSPIIHYGSRPSRSDISIEDHEYTQEARNSDATSMQAPQSPGIRDGAQSFTHISKMAKGSSEPTVNEIADVTGIASNEYEIRPKLRNYYFDMGNDTNEVIYSPPDAQVEAQKLDKAKKQKETPSSGRSKPDLVSVAGLKKLEKKIEKHFKQVKDHGHDNRSAVSTQELRRLEWELVQQLQRVDEKRAAKLERLRKKAKNISDDKSVALKITRRYGLASKNTKPLNGPDTRDSNRYNQLQSLRSSKQLGRYIGRSSQSNGLS
eukprot:scaffold2563_cov124-Cylindrotheca_fusiformis.AAC.17